MRRFAPLVLALAMLAYPTSGIAYAVDPRISNAAIYAEADSYPSGTGVGVCKSWVESVFNAVAEDAGASLRLGSGYYGCYQDAGGSQVQLAEAVRGDVVQVYESSEPETYHWGMHVAIVVDNLGGGVLNVIDANWNVDGLVLRHQWNVPAHLSEHEGLEVAVWRLGTVDPPEPPPPPPPDPPDPPGPPDPPAPPDPPDPPAPPATVLAPIYRFYNASNETHFYTDSDAERDMVIARWPDVYSFEGTAYRTNPARNTQSLYRFYNRRSGSHFYTASAEEAAAVLSKWGETFTLDGRTYKVSPGPIDDSIPVFRFYNKRNGSHFYTASSGERDTVITRWSAVYDYEGPAFWLGQ
jgi:hypothetical protein